jgi:hypothetical protein
MSVTYEKWKKKHKKKHTQYKAKSMKLYNISIYFFTMLVYEMRATGTYWYKQTWEGVLW